MTLATLEATARAPRHPALRWRPALGDQQQHRRELGGADRTACGKDGPLMLADTDADWCSTCFPGR